MAEKTINQISADARRLHTKAVEAAQRENADYAVTLYSQVLEKEPGFVDCRRALRTEQYKKAAAAGGGFFKKMMSGAGSSPQLAKAKLSLSKSPAEAMAVAEQGLGNGPSSNVAHRIVFDAAQALEMPLTMVLQMENMVKNSPKDKALLIEYATLVAETGTNASACEKVLNDFIRNSPYDTDLLQVQKNLSARKTMDEQGYHAIESGTASYRDILRNKEEAASLEQENRVQKSDDVAERLIGEYEERLHTEPNNWRVLRQLAELYTQKGRFDEALGIYARIKASDMGNDSSLDRAITETTVRRFDFQIGQLDAAVPENAEPIAKLTAEKLAYQMTECQKRVEKYPTDMALRYEMGQLYFQAGKISEAIGEFQKAQSNPHKRIAAMSYLSQCFSRRKMYDLAAGKLQEALKEKPGFDDEKKELIYQLGCVLENMGKKDEAFEQFKIIYATDINYRDVGVKVDAYYAAQGG